MKIARNKDLIIVCIMIIGCKLLYNTQHDATTTVNLKSLLGNVNWKNDNHEKETSIEPLSQKDETYNESQIIRDENTFITVICCKQPDRNGLNEIDVQSKFFKQLIALLKSAAITTKTILRFHIVTNMELKKLKNSVTNITNTWPEEFRSRMKINYNNMYYPTGTEDIQKMGLPCVTQRLFLPDLFIDMDAAVYLDLDTIFLRSPEDLWEEFKKFDDFQLAAVGDSNYFIGKTIPYYGGGINPGIMMMNMTRMRQLMLSIPVKDLWSSAMINIANSYKGRVENDMDILNVFFKMNPRLIYILPCWWTFIKSYCESDYPCVKTMESANRGVALLHGAGKQFEYEISQMQFKAVYEAFNVYNFESSIESFYTELKKNLIASRSWISIFCDDNENMTQIMTLELERHIYKI